MNRRFLSTAIAAGLVASLLGYAPVGAQPTVPAEVQIEDPFGDANTTSGNQVTPADASTVADYGKIWFTNTAESVTVHILTERPGPGSATGTSYNVWTNPNADLQAPYNGCLRFSINIPGANANGGTLQGEPLIRLVDQCNDGTSLFDNGVDGELGIEQLQDQTGVTSATFPRSYSALLGTGAVLTSPSARSDFAIGATTNPPSFSRLRADDTVVGSDYALADGEVGPRDDLPGKDDPPGKDKKKAGKDKKKGCKKGKGNKNGACPGKNKKKKPKLPASCAAYEAGEQGAEAETTVVTDAATEEEPEELSFEFGPGIPENPGQEHVFHNVQVDSSGGDVGLYVRFEFDVYEDMDLWLRYPSGTEVARAAGYNPAPVLIFNGTGNGGHSEQGAEQLDGIRTADCQGFTIDMATFQNFPGEKTLKLWLGEVQNDPKPDQQALVTTVLGLF